MSAAEGLTLLPCPLCGSAEIVHAMRQTCSEVGWEDGLGSPGTLWFTHRSVRCNSCRCQVEMLDASEEDVAARWNCRSHPPAPASGGDAISPTWQCVNCSTVDEFSVQHCEPDEHGAVYPVIECHVCGLKCSDYRGEEARAAALNSSAKEG